MLVHHGVTLFLYMATKRSSASLILETHKCAVGLHDDRSGPWYRKAT